MKNNFTGFILAGGKSSRMGADKLALEIGGETFLERAATTLETVCGKVVVVLNRTQTIEIDLPVVRDYFAGRGALGGIHAALSNCETKFAVILAVDLPLVTAEAIENLTKIALVSERHFAFVPLQPDGKFQPLCAVYHVKNSLPPLEKLLDENEKASVKDFINLICPKYVEANHLSADEHFLFNVNQPKDFQILQ